MLRGVVRIPEEPSLFPNQPKVDEHIAKNQTQDSPFAPKVIKVTDVATRLKILEERYSTLRKKMLLSEQTVIESEKNHFQEIQILNSTILDLKRNLKEVLEKVSLLSDEIGNFAPRTEMITLQRYIEYWQPMDFVTRKEVNDFLRKKLGPKNKNKSPEKKEIKEKKPDEKNKKTKQKKSKVSIEDAYPDSD